MRRIVVIISAELLLLAAGEPLATSKPSRVGQVSVLDLKSKSANPMKFCSRPAELAGFWMASRADVSACERAAESYLRRSTRRLSRKFGEYNRQYVGIERDGRRVVYLNALYTGHDLAPAVMDVLANACDGGDRFWGLVCDPTSAKISEFEINND